MEIVKERKKTPSLPAPVGHQMSDSERVEEQRPPGHWLKVRIRMNAQFIKPSIPPPQTR
jgi:hypothetical protein